MTAWKNIPIFLSSTFRDMHAERDHLARVVFPGLEERLRERRCRIEPIDLRVGVETDDAGTEAAREAQILKVCLQEIDRSRPFLVALLGDRYGWAPPEDRVRAASQEAGFNPDTAAMSVTALEIEYGLLRKEPRQKRRCLIYMREPLPYDRMEGRAADFSEAHAGDPEAAPRADRLARLKRKLRDDPELQGHLRSYTLDWNETARGFDAASIEAWGRQVEADLWNELEVETRAFAARAEPTWGQAERFAIEEMVERLKRGFVGRKRLVSDAIAVATSADTARSQWGLCFTGESGAGKSALFARVHRALSILAHLPQTRAAGGLLLLSHAAGVSPRAGQTEWMLRRWIGELGEALGERVEVPEDMKPEALEKLFAETLGRAAMTRRVIVLVDALNQFVRTERARTVSWLPEAWPANARFICTTIPGEESARLTRQQRVEIVSVPPLDVSEAEAIARKVYGRYHRAPNREVLAEVMARRLADGAPAASNPLWLTLALDLLNLFDADDFSAAEADAAGTSTEKLRRMLRARAQSLPPTMEELYGVFLRQVEKVAGTAETRAFASLIALSRNGWREEDFAHLLPAAPGILSPASFSENPLLGKLGALSLSKRQSAIRNPPSWDPLRFAILRRCFRAHLVKRGALEQWDFAHASLRVAIRRRLENEWRPAAAETVTDIVPALYACGADYLEALPPGELVREDEIIWQMLGTRDAVRVAGYYAQPTSGSKLLALYLAEDEEPDDHPLLQFVVSLLAAEPLEDATRVAVAHKFIFDLHDELAVEGRLPVRRALLEAAENAWNELCARNPQSADYTRYLAVSYSKLGDVHRGLGNGAQVREFYEKALGIAEELRARNRQSTDYARDFSVSCDRLGDVHLGLGHGAQAREFYEKALGMREELRARNPQSADYARNLAVSYSKLGDVHLGLGHGAQARESYEKALGMREELRARNPQGADYARDLSVSYGKLGDVHLGLGHGAQALEFYEKALGIAGELRARNPQRADYAQEFWVSYFKLGDLHLGLGHGAQALESYEKALGIAEELRARNPQGADYARDLSVSCERLGDVHLGLGHGAQAREFYEKALGMREGLRARNPQNADYAQGLSVICERLGDVHLGLGHGAQARESYEKALGMREELRARNPQRADYARDVAVSHFKLYKFHEARNRSTAMAHLKSCHGMLRGMRDRGMDLDQSATKLLEQLDAAFSRQRR